MDRRAEPPQLHSATFSKFIAKQFTEFSGDPTQPETPDAKPAAMHLNGLWLRSPGEPFHPPVIDFLIEHYDEPSVTPRPGSVSTYAWRPDGGTLRITADEPTLAGGLSAWWVHAETPQRLAEFARLLLPWGTLRETLRADTEPAREVLNRVRGGTG
jgi:hypothetical protein